MKKVSNFLKKQGLLSLVITTFIGIFLTIYAAYWMATVLAPNSYGLTGGPAEIGSAQDVTTYLNKNTVITVLPASSNTLVPIGAIPYSNGNPVEYMDFSFNVFWNSDNINLAPGTKGTLNVDIPITNILWGTPTPSAVNQVLTDLLNFEITTTNLNTPANDNTDYSLGKNATSGQTLATNASINLDDTNAVVVLIRVRLSYPADKTTYDLLISQFFQFAINFTVTNIINPS